MSPQGPSSAAELTAEPAEVTGEDAIHQHSVPTGPSCQGGFLPSGTFPREPVLGSPQLVQEGPESKQNAPGCPRPCQGSASSRSSPSTLGAAGSVVIPECAHWWHIHQGSLCLRNATQGPSCFPSPLRQPRPKRPETGDDQALLSKRGVCIFQGLGL